MDYESVISRVEGIAAEVGLYAESQRDSATIMIKQDGSAVSDVDTECEARIRNALEGLVESAGFVGEETGGSVPREGIAWVIDPIDGTSNYLQGLPGWCVSISLWQDGIPVLGAIYEPAYSRTYSAFKGGGLRIDREPVEPSDSPRTCVIVTKGRRDGSWDKMRSALDAISPITTSTRRYASCALELAYVASGRASCMITWGEQPWDLGAGIVLAHESGKKVSSWDGSPWDINKPDVLVSEDQLHGAFVSALKDR